MKTCSRCMIVKPVDQFGRMAAKRDGRAPHCKLCAAEYDLRRKPRQTERRKGIQQDRTAIRKNYHARHPDQRKIEAARRDKNYFSRYIRQRYREDPGFNLLLRLRSRTRKALLGISKSVATRELIGCSTEALRAWIEKQFLAGMSWANMTEWELDHVRPLASFDLTDEAQLRKAAHHTNLQPLWRADNRRKGAKWH